MDVDPEQISIPRSVLASIYSLVRFNNLVGLQTLLNPTRALDGIHLTDLEFDFSWSTDTSSYGRWPKNCTNCPTCHGLMFFGNPTTLEIIEEALAWRKRTGLRVNADCTCERQKHHLDLCRRCGFKYNVTLKCVGIEKYCEIRGFEAMGEWIAERIALEQINRLTLSK